MKILVFDADREARNIYSAGLSHQEIIFFDGPVSIDALKAHADADIISLFVTSALKSEHIELLPRLACIIARSTGVDHIDRAVAAERNIVVCNVPSYGSRTVAEFTFALLLSLSRRISDAANHVRRTKVFDTAGLEGFDLFGKTLGVIGTGAIGRNVVALATAFGMPVLMFDLFPNTALMSATAQYVSLDELLASADIISLHAPSTPQTKHILNREAFTKMKRGVYIINTARGELIDSAALLEALKNETVAGAALDVLEEERSLKEKDTGHNQSIINKPNVIITPHIAFFSKEAHTEILTTSVQNTLAFISGKPRNVVSL